ncbi:unnamed protein product [Rotaria sp. Silwood1]|nr:unnamed protein product [Rotaria sp. Silwood1]CAF1572060.1 unnamed protein product [Rotaria sp. Silwood1]CAF1574060.1 unnamed protein product [Rotaria sp. Silwood1]CAF3657690.1 unnamed protein product [Rotaria sp. Silwood1]CAF3671961.1 unnamed protein product [Rotaria sp. Silwood1]
MVDNSLLSEGTTPYYTDERDFGRFSDHVTVWIDKYIGEENTYGNFKEKFDNNIQVLQSNNVNEMEIDDDAMLCANPDMLKKLTHDVYCLKYFSTIEKGLEYIHKNSDKKIFFISSGTIGKIIVPQIANLSQIQGIYIFCGNISRHTEWAGEYVDKIVAMLEHQDNLLERLTRDIAEYVEKKGDEYKTNDKILQARNCYAWSKKLLIRGQLLGDIGTKKLIDKITKKIDEVQSSAECHS